MRSFTKFILRYGKDRRKRMTRVVYASWFHVLPSKIYSCLQLLVIGEVIKKNTHMKIAQDNPFRRSNQLQKVFAALVIKQFCRTTQGSSLCRDLCDLLFCCRQLKLGGNITKPSVIFRSCPPSRLSFSHFMAYSN